MVTSSGSLQSVSHFSSRPRFWNGDADPPLHESALRAGPDQRVLVTPARDDVPF